MNGHKAGSRDKVYTYHPSENEYNRPVQNIGIWNGGAINFFNL